MHNDTGRTQPPSLSDLARYQGLGGYLSGVCV